MVNVLALNRYGKLGASSRMRSLQYFPLLEVAGLSVRPQALFDDAALTSRYQTGGYDLPTAFRCYRERIGALLSRNDFDLVWIEKEALPWWPQWIEAALLRGIPYVLDYDDAIFHNYDLHRLAVVRHLYGQRLDRIMMRATLVVCGNEYLAQRARDAGAPWVEVLPTVINLQRYPCSDFVQTKEGNAIPIVVWIGSPSTVRYLQLLEEPLRALAQRIPFVLRVVGGDFALPGVQVECVSWSEDTEVASIANGDVGIMPLLDSPWERGKCGYKLIQYMACGLPVVASPVGLNSTIVQDGVNGYLAKDAQAWVNRLEQLLTSASLRTQMGAAGRQRVEQEYCLQVTGPRLANWLHKVAKKGG